MNRIRLLSEQVANQIAAGEVVERPASVVKELVENALDAQATRITIEIQAGGRSLVRVTDDGFGMNRDDALLCLERHATSKIQKAEDLGSIATMGFRGEALPSIASVSRFMLTTRERESAEPEGTQIVINGGKVIEVKAGGNAGGTTVEVRQLFFNLPARRKFLRSEETESSHIQHYLTLAALAYPEVGFTFLRDGRTVWQMPPIKAENRSAALRERLRTLQGSDEKLLPLDFSAPLVAESVEETLPELEETAQTPAMLRVWGFIGAPGVARSTREDQHLFVNRRPVENRGLNFALLEGYHTALMKGRYPVCCLFVEIGPDEVDVNIHPAKREVKFHKEKLVRLLVAQAVRQTLLAYHVSPFHTLTATTAQPPRPMSTGTLTASSPARPLPPAARELPQFQVPARPGTILPPRQESPAASPLAARPETGLPTVPVPGDAQATAVTPTAPGAVQSGGGTLPSRGPETFVGGAPMPLLAVPLRLVGVVGRLYVILESDRGLVLLDQHAAHERILFEQMLERLEQQDQAPSQRLLLPETVEIPARDAQFLREQLATLTRLGVGLSEFGERTFLLDGLPPFVKAKEPRRFVLELVDELKAVGEGVNTLRLGEQMVAKTVCRHAIKANDPLTGPELERLVEDLRHCRMPYTCPHGRPTLIEMNYRELEKKFGRQQ